VVLVDDDRLVRAGLAAVLGVEPDFEVVGTAEDGHEALSVVRDTDPDLVLMDIRMPGLDGLATTRELLSRNAERPKVLVLTTFELDEYVFQALQVGASGFMLKRVEPEELLAGLRLVAAGESLLFPAMTRRLVEHYQVLANRSDGRIEAMTAREQEVLTLMARGLSNAEIAEELILGVETIKTHVTNTLSKLGVRDRTQAVIYAYERGFVVPDADPGT
jgi:DNA-binding NarL/FixJ family response regulator